MPNEALREASPPRLSIGTDRHGGGCKGRLLPTLCHLHYARSVPRGRTGANLRTTARGEGTAEVAEWRTLDVGQLDDHALPFTIPVGSMARTALAPGARA